MTAQHRPAARPGRDRQRHGRRPRGRGDPRPRRRRRSSRSPCSATSRTATTTASCCPTCWPARRTTDEIYLNPLDWYDENGIRCTPACGSCASTGSPSTVYADDGTTQPYDKLIIATGSRPFFPPMEGMWLDDRHPHPGRVRLPHAGRRHAMIDYAARARSRGGHRRRPARPGGGARAAATTAARCTSSSRRHADEPAARRAAGAILRQAIERARASRCTPASAPPRSSASGSVDAASASPTARTLDCDMVVVAAGIRPNVGLGVRPG